VAGGAGLEGSSAMTGGLQWTAVDEMDVRDKEDDAWRMHVTGAREKDVCLLLKQCEG
jgi:hypothetical protein